MRNEPKVFRTLEEAAGQFGPGAIAIGNFDGVHVGHQVLIRASVEHAQKHGFVPAVLTFHPHPAAVVAPERKVGFVSPLEERVRLLGEAGAQHILVLPFTEEVSRLTAEQFVRKILVEALETKAIFVGDSFRFGYRQGGSIATLRELGPKLGFVSEFLRPVKVRGELVSSSVIRRCVEDGKVARAGRLLGRCFSVKGPVVTGHGVGSKQTVPTLNLRPVPGQVLPRGVFVTETREAVTDRCWQSITNVGVRPTFGGDEVSIETFLLGPLFTNSRTTDSPGAACALEGDTPLEIEVLFRHFVRPERQFSSAELLKQQIFHDVARAKAYWRRAGYFRRFHFVQ